MFLASIALIELIMFIIIPPVARSLLFIGNGDSSLGDVVGAIGTKTADGIYYKHQRGNSSSRTIVINFHGNYQIISSRNSVFDKMKSNVNAIYEVEYRGYGGVPGNPDEISLSDDLKNFVKWVEREHPKQQIILEGYSVGATLVLLNLHSLGSQINGAVVFSPFSSLTDIVKSLWFTKIFFVRDCGWNVLEEIRKGTKVPVLIFGAEDDKTVPIELTRHISEEMKEGNNLNKFYEFENGGHFLPFSRSHRFQISKYIRSFLSNI
jgi:alpha-beta hydrolase superfamily lysophospholipase